MGGTVRQVLRGTIAGTGLFLLLQFVLALVKLTRSTGAMDNEFSRLAREDYLSYVIRQNLMMLSAYVVLWVLAVLLLTPAVSLWCRRCKYRGRGSVVIPAFLFATGVHGYFLLRLLQDRPYFLGPENFGHWYYGILKLPPESWQPALHTALFTVLPVLVLPAAAFWWLRRMSVRWRIGVVATAVMALTGGLVASRTGDAAGPAAGPDRKRPNILVIASDSLRGDRVGYSGYRPARTDGPAAAGVSPRIDAWSAACT